jgi:membrane-bound inhibitor of C-type lysozyme
MYLTCTATSGEFYMFRQITICLGAALFLTGYVVSTGQAHAADKSYKTRSAIYSCDDGTDFIANFSGELVTLTIASGPIVILPQKKAASGIWYSNGMYDLRGKGLNAVFRAPKRQAANCLALD